MASNIMIKALITILILFPFAGFSQNIIKGTVKDALSKESLPGCTIYINNTTIGTNSDSEGNFFLDVGSQNTVNVILSYIGYESISRKIDFLDNKIQLIEVELSLKENTFLDVQVSTKKDRKWERQLKKFTNSFLGYSDFAKKCKIENPWILNFEEENGELKTNANEPLKIKNSALGYYIIYELKHFVSTSESYGTIGNVQFEELQPKNKKEFEYWTKNRNLSYQKSPTYLFKSILNQSLLENGFELFIKNPKSTLIRTDDFNYELNNSNILKYDITKDINFGNKPNIKIITIPDNLEIHNKFLKSPIKTYSNFDYAVSWMQFRNQKVQVNTEGIPINPEDMVISGDMNYLKFAGILPLNYKPSIDHNTSNLQNKASLSILDKENLNKNETLIIPEKVTLHTNKSSFRQGETIWFKSYQTFSNISNQKSGVVYVDLINSTNKVITSKIIKTENGIGWGEIKISDTLTRGVYGLRRYTNWMRNFGDSTLTIQEIKIFTKSDKITNPEQNIQSIQNDWLTLPSHIVKNGDSLIINLSGIPNSSYSISITNENSVSGYDKLPRISFPSYKPEKIIFPLEISGRVFKGKLETKENTNVWNFGDNFNNTESYITSKEGDFFVENIIQKDSIKLNLIANNSKGKPINKIELIDFGKPVTNHIFSNFDFIYLNNVSNSNFEKSYDFDLDKMIMLEEVEIKGKKTENPLLTRERTILGTPNQSFITKDLIKSSAPNVLMALTSQVPNLKTVYNQETHSMDIRWTRPGNRLPLIPKILLDGFELSSPNDLQHIKPEAISRIDVYHSPVTVANAQSIISIYTKTYLNDPIENSMQKKGLNQFAFLGFSFPKNFYLPNLERDSNRLNQFENRSTIYWNPNIMTKQKGDSEIKILMVGKAGNYRIEIVGMNSNGELEKKWSSIQVTN